MMMMMASRDAARAAAQPGSVLVVVHDFKARSSDELSLTKGDRIELIERDDDFNDGWFLGRHILTGTTGLFPEVYTTAAPKSSQVSQSLNALRRTSGSMPNAVQAQEASSSSSSLQRPASASTLSTSQQRPSSAASTFSKPPSISTARSSLPSDTKMMSLSNTQSPVMHETLTVIDEHMNDMNPPAFSRATANRRDTMGSVYSTHPSRMSYIAGHETEDEEGSMYTEAEVMKWTSAHVAEYLEDHGVERSHCRVFREQEITGEVLLAMDQSSVFLKEFDLGPVGRRLRTWHKIKTLQDEAQRNAAPGAPNLTITAHELEANEVARHRSTSASAAFPPAPRNVAPLRSSTVQSSYGSVSPTMSLSNSGTLLSANRQDTTYRPSAQNIRTMQHWRHSSVDSTATSIDGSLQPGHRKQSSVDQRSPLMNGKFTSHSRNVSTETTPYANKDPVFGAQIPGSSDPDKGYFSSNEAESRSARKSNVLQKKSVSSAAASTHSRNGSLFNNYGRRSNPVASTDSLHDPIVSPLSSPMSASGSFGQKMGASRTISMPAYGTKAVSTVNESPNPIVTKLEPYSPTTGGSSTANVSPMPASGMSSEATTPGTASKLPFFSKTSKIPGMRAISDAVTRHEKSTAKDGDAKDCISTPSTGAASFDLKTGARTSAGSASGLVPQPQATPRRPKTKTKKSTSAYTRGLEKKSPAEQMVGCDYSGWMKKKSGSLMTTWKPRLFVLRGRRLSYYYSEDDTEEKGLIDISFHNVMPATDERLTTMHAAMTGAGAAASPKDSLTTTSQQEMMDNPPQPGTDDDNLFIFKLTPPKSGRGVNFTKPTVHYFAVNSRQEGRLWMAALMKAVIDRDRDGVVQTTYTQQTISLAKARARRERPPALQDDETAGAADVYEHTGPNEGLGIDGLRMSRTSASGGMDGADRPYLTEDNSSIAASTIPTAAPSIVMDLGDLEKDSLSKILQ